MVGTCADMHLLPTVLFRSDAVDRVTELRLLALMGPPLT